MIEQGTEDRIRSLFGSPAGLKGYLVILEHRQRMGWLRLVTRELP